jgi:hypothetical protein
MVRDLGIHPDSTMLLASLRAATFLKRINVPIKTLLLSNLPPKTTFNDLENLFTGFDTHNIRYTPGSDHAYLEIPTDQGPMVMSFLRHVEWYGQKLTAKIIDGQPNGDVDDLEKLSTAS